MLVHPEKALEKMYDTPRVVTFYRPLFSMFLFLSRTTYRPAYRPAPYTQGTKHG